MQIRIFNRQDDKALRAIIGQLGNLDLDDKDSDLRNVEGTYFGNNGIFLVAEDDGQIKAYMGARLLNKTDNSDKRHDDTGDQEILTVTRKGVATGIPEAEAHELLDKLMTVVLNHAYQLDFAKVEVTDLAR
jgi:hypothetical protein